jgi:RimJ/RimL family protein N-acetyltransferase
MVHNCGVTSPLPVPEPPLRDAAVALRPWRDSDLEPLLAGAGDPLVQRYRRSLPENADQAQLWLAATSAERERGERLELAICTAADPAAPLGSVSLWSVHRRHGHAMMSWWIGPAGRGTGMATAAVRLVAGWAFTTLGLVRIGAFVEQSNARSVRMAQRAGFQREGTLRSFLERRDGSFADCTILSLLPGDLPAEPA